MQFSHPWRFSPALGNSFRFSKPVNSGTPLVRTCILCGGHRGMADLIADRCACADRRSCCRQIPHTGRSLVFTTAVAYLNIHRRCVQAHRERMMRSYALTAAAITLRMYLLVLLISGIPLAKAYPVVAWICWIPNLLFAEWLLRRDGT